MIKHHDPEFETVIDNAPPRFGRIRWFLVRRLLAALNLVEGRFQRLREWALQEAVESSPDFDTFEAWVTEHYAARGRKVTVDVIKAVVPPVVPTPPPTQANPSTWVD
jgi:hypothetical protein